MLTKRRMALAVVVGWATVLTGCGTQVAYDPFYAGGTSPDGARRDAVTPRPGDLVDSRSSRFTRDPFQLTPVAGIRSWQVTYHSTTHSGAPTVVSGTVLVPTRPWTGQGPRPLVSYGVGTRGLGDECAPSKTLASGIDYESGVIDEALQRGWAVAVSDMVGLGTPGQHTFEVGRDQGAAVLDMARAALRLPEAGLDPRAPIGIWGYSQGGTSAGWAAQLAPTYAPELHIAGVAAGGVPADLRAVAANLDGNPFFSLLTLAAAGYDAAYPELHLDTYLNEAGRKLFAEARDFCIVSVAGIATFLQLAGRHMSDFLAGTNPLTTPAWVAALDDNKLGGSAPTAPVLMVHAIFDEVIPREQAVTLRDTWCREGAQVEWIDVLGEHAIGLPASLQHSLDFLAARFAGLAPTSTCPPG